MGVETPVELSKEQQEHIVTAQQRFCQVCHILIIYTDTKASITVGPPLGAFDGMGVKTPVELSKEQQEHILAAQQRFCQVCHRLIIYTETKASISVLLWVLLITW